MCLITRNQKQISQEDIIVFKILCDDLKSIYYSFKYDLGATYQTEIDFSNDWVVADARSLNVIRGIIEENNLDIGHFNEIQNKNKLKDIGFNCYGAGFHSYNTYERAKNQCLPNQLIVECTIPSGSEYIIGEDGCVVCEQLILNKILK